VGETQKESAHLCLPKMLCIAFFLFFQKIPFSKRFWLPLGFLLALPVYLFGTQ
jgi:hypothetical protein